MKHKIRNVDIEICCAEQKIAYNYLFAYASCVMNNDAISYVKMIVHKDIYRRNDMTRYDRQYIFELFCDNLQKYIDNKMPIFGNYKDLGNFIR